MLGELSASLRGHSFGSRSQQVLNRGVAAGGLELQGQRRNLWESNLYVFYVLHVRMLARYPSPVNPSFANSARHWAQGQIVQSEFSVSQVTPAAKAVEPPRIPRTSRKSIRPSASRLRWSSTRSMIFLWRKLWIVSPSIDRHRLKSSRVSTSGRRTAT